MEGISQSIYILYAYKNGFIVFQIYSLSAEPVPIRFDSAKV
jgi:hypothetical protein